MWPQAGSEYRIAIDHQVLRRDRRTDNHVTHPIYRIRRCDVLKNDLEVGKFSDHRPQHTVQKLALTIEYVDVRVCHLTMHTKHHPDALHPLEHRVDAADI